MEGGERVEVSGPIYSIIVLPWRCTGKIGVMGFFLNLVSCCGGSEVRVGSMSGDDAEKPVWGLCPAHISHS